MFFAKADQRVFGYFGRALSLELSAVQLYSTQARLVAAWGLTADAARLSKEASEELEHADRIIARMLALGAAPNASMLRPVKLGRSLPELLQHNNNFENELVKLYDDAMRYCASIGDHDNRVFFETLLGDEKKHADALLQWLNELEQPSFNMVSKMNQSRVTF